MTVIGLLAGCSSVSWTACLREHLASNGRGTDTGQGANEDTVLMTVIPNSSSSRSSASARTTGLRNIWISWPTRPSSLGSLFLPVGDTLLYQYSFPA